jgi:hypothetical protein
MAVKKRIKEKEKERKKGEKGGRKHDGFLFLYFVR